MDYYRILGIERNASKKEIKEAYRRLAFKYHPDRHVKSTKAVQEEALRRFKQVSEAYDVLSDDTRRANYAFSSGYPSDYSFHGRRSSASYSYRRPSNSVHGWQFRFGSPLLYFSRLDFLFHAALFGTLFGCIYVVDATSKILWESKNKGKSFEAAMDVLSKRKEEKGSGIQEHMDFKDR
eukprot:TRINITY_DN8316_c0_g4_i1.p1 TRINITY_DN8316_c0_g4~~TRINITY_DN8316_c0_g4_i1.p1  ORF type:complete len:179 (+),score=18.71 TRINITY_DN8316_c0_g4_i1:228-764(+)